MLFLAWLFCYFPSFEAPEKYYKGSSPRAANAARYARARWKIPTINIIIIIIIYLVERSYD